MSHQAYRRIGWKFKANADYVVVGSGAGGAVAAERLARSGASVIVVEAGAWRDPSDYPYSAYGGVRDLMDGSTTVAQGRALWPVVQARVVGGTTVVNSAICVRTPAQIFAQWETELGLSYTPWEREFERLQDEIEAELHLEHTAPKSMGRSNELALKADRALNYGGHVIRRYANGCEGSGQCLQGCRSGAKQSMNLTYIPWMLAHSAQNGVVSCAPVKKLKLKRGRAVSVVGRFRHPATRKRGDRFEISARKAILIAASCVHSPLILHRSGYRHPALGGGFRSHPGTGVFGLYDEAIDGSTGVTQGWATTKFYDDRLKLETLSIPLELIASRFSGGGQALMARLKDFRHVAMWVQATNAYTTGTVSQGPFGMPTVRYDFEDRDMRTLRHGMWLVAKAHVAAGAREIIPGIYGMPFSLRPNDVDRILDAPLDPRCYIAVLSHLFGGCTMGTNPITSVCDELGRVRGLSNVYIADASQLPTTLGINPQHTIMAMAKWRAENLIDGAIQ